jgi:hypothetical protein
MSRLDDLRAEHRRVLSSMESIAALGAEEQR